MIKNIVEKYIYLRKNLFSNDIKTILTKMLIVNILV